MISLYDVVKRQVLTEKSQVAGSKNNEYVFEVDRRANKIEVKKAVEELFGVKVIDVRTSIKKPEVKIKGKNRILTPIVKKAVVRLKEGNTIGK